MAEHGGALKSHYPGGYCEERRFTRNQDTGQAMANEGALTGASRTEVAGNLVSSGRITAGMRDAIARCMSCAGVRGGGLRVCVAVHAFLSF